MLVRRRRRHAGFNLLEVALSLAIVVVLLAILVPAMNSARTVSHLQQCASNQRQLGELWNSYLDDHDQQFPEIPLQPGWHYGGVRFSAVTGNPFLDFERPLNGYLDLARGEAACEQLFLCPADHGITDAGGVVGTGQRTAYRSFGTSFRANEALVGARRSSTSPAVCSDPRS